MFAQFMPVLLVLAVAAAFSGLFLGLSFWLGPRRPSALKDSTYECGVPVRGTTQIRFFVRFFLVAIFFLLFDLEAVFLYPWVITFRDLVAAGHGAFALAEMGPSWPCSWSGSFTSGAKAAWNGSRSREPQQLPDHAPAAGGQLGT
jgi:NADH-quinone oxidoreductase subunit A